MKDTDLAEREKKLDWFFKLSSEEIFYLKSKYFLDTYIPVHPHWGLAFTTGQIYEMYDNEHLHLLNNDITE